MIDSLRFTVELEGERINCRVDSRADAAADAPFLLSLAGGADETLDAGAFAQPGLPFLEAGGRVMSLDLPCHAGRTADGQGEGIAGFSNLYARGEDIFGRIVRECGAALDAAIGRGLARPGRIALCGCSRGGYCALRLFAGDARIAAAAAVSPVTDWRYLFEFAAHAGEQRLHDMALVNFAPGMAGRPVFMAIGGHDGRVSTESCMRLHLVLSDENERRGLGRALSTLVVTEDQNHSLSLPCRRRCGEFLLSALN